MLYAVCCTKDNESSSYRSHIVMIKYPHRIALILSYDAVNVQEGVKVQS